MTREEECETNQREYGDKPCRQCWNCVEFYRKRESDAVFQIAQLEEQVRKLEAARGDKQGARDFVTHLDTLLDNPKIEAVVFVREEPAGVRQRSMRAVPKTHAPSGRPLRNGLVMVEGDTCRKVTRCEVRGTSEVGYRRLVVDARTNENRVDVYVPYGVRCHAMVTGMECLTVRGPWVEGDETEADDG